MATARPVIAEFVWSENNQFRATSGTNTLLVDGDSAAGPSPVQLLVIAFGACMAIDVVDILRKGRHAVLACRLAVEAGRAAETPRRLLSFNLNFTIEGRVPSAAVERAISLSREKYCSVWHSLKEDIVLTTKFEVLKPE